MSYNLIVILGPTAVGKTALAVRTALALNTEIISADSRQVYKKLDIGSGKDLADYDADESLVSQINPDLKEFCSDGKFHVPYHLIDIISLPSEYNVFDFQTDFYKVFTEIQSRGKIPILCGGTGMYLDSVVRGYKNLVRLPEENPEFLSERAALQAKSYEELKKILIAEKKDLHNTTDFADKDRIIRALEIERFLKSDDYKGLQKKIPEVKPLVIGTTLERPLVREKIARRLKERMEGGLIEEVLDLHEKDGIEWGRLESLGLEYRFVSNYLQGKISSKEELFEKLRTAICQFAKRQETWFRGMQKKGVSINWLPQEENIKVRFQAILDLLEKNGLFIQK